MAQTFWLDRGLSLTEIGVVATTFGTLLSILGAVLGGVLVAWRGVFFGLVVVLVPILREGLTPARFRRLEEHLGVSRRTVLRWRRFWQELFPASRQWPRVLADLVVVDRGRLPGSLLGAFTGVAAGRDRLVAALRWLAQGESWERAR